MAARLTSLRALAKRLGVAHTVVEKAVRSGRLERSVTRDAKGRAKVLDVDLAEREWRENRDPSRACGDGEDSAPDERQGTQEARSPRRKGHDRGSGSLVSTDARAREDFARRAPGGRQDRRAERSATYAEIKKRVEIARARKLELANDERAGRLVLAAAAERRYTAMVVEARNALLGVPTRAKQRLPHLTVTDVAELERLLREALEGLAGHGTRAR